MQLKGDKQQWHDIQYFLDCPAATGHNLLNGGGITQKGRLSRNTLLDISAQENANSWNETNFDVSTRVAKGRLRSQVKQLSNISVADTRGIGQLSTYMDSPI